MNDRQGETSQAAADLITRVYSLVLSREKGKNYIEILKGAYHPYSLLRTPKFWVKGLGSPLSKAEHSGGVDPYSESLKPEP